MNKEDKELLLKDLCARIPYGVKCYDEAQREVGVFKHFEYDGFGRIHNGRGVRFIENIKPYLFPLYSMTEEQKKELEDNLVEMELKAISDEIKHVDVAAYEIDFYNKHHIDYRGLIEKGLAVDATGMNIY